MSGLVDVLGGTLSPWGVGDRQGGEGHALHLRLQLPASILNGEESESP